MKPEDKYFNLLIIKLSIDLRSSWIFTVLLSLGALFSLYLGFREPAIAAAIVIILGGFSIRASTKLIADLKAEKAAEDFKKLNQALFPET